MATRRTQARQIQEYLWGPLATPWGSWWLVFSHQGLTRLVWGEAPPALPQAPHDHPIPRLWTPRLQAYLRGECPPMDGPLDLAGLSPFAREVYALLRGIPYGEVRTYGQLARALGRPAAARAVGRALARNPLPIIIPCHRVVSARGDLHGFSAPGGIETKARLLAWERRFCRGRPHAREFVRPWPAAL